MEKEQLSILCWNGPVVESSERLWMGDAQTGEKKKISMWNLTLILSKL